MNYEEAYKEMSNCILKIETPNGYGTGFIGFDNDSYIGIATAYHVVKSAHIEQYPIKITHYNSQKSLWILPGCYNTVNNEEADSSFIFIEKRFINFSDICIIPPKFLNYEDNINIGCNTCWLGFPNITPNVLCIFSGIISSIVTLGGDLYIIDGVSIHGVSGGPVVVLTDDGYKVIGIVTGYRPNVVNENNVLPGLMYSRDVSHFLNVLRDINSFEEINENKQTLEEKL